MKCYVTNNSPYARKVCVVAHETGVYDEVDWKKITREERGDLQNFNPLGKVPVAILDTGDIVWFNRSVSAIGDLRKPEPAKNAISVLLKSAPIAAP